MKRLLLVFSLIIALAICANAQSNRFWANNSVELDADRYKKHQGSPYLFEEFLSAQITSFNGQVYQSIPINFNAHTQEFEIRKKEQLYLLNQQKYLIIKILKSENQGKHDWGQDDKIVFKRGFHPDFLEHFVHMVYDGRGIKLIREIRQGLDEKTFQDVGKTIEIKRFNSKDKHYFIIEGESKEVKIKEKDIKKALGHKNEVEDYVKENNLSLVVMEDLIKLLSYLEERELY